MSVVLMMIKYVNQKNRARKMNTNIGELTISLIKRIGRMDTLSAVADSATTPPPTELRRLWRPRKNSATTPPPPVIHNISAYVHCYMKDIVKYMHTNTNTHVYAYTRVQITIVMLFNY